jgi:Flagellar assembly protein FliH
VTGGEFAPLRPRRFVRATEPRPETPPAPPPAPAIEPEDAAPVEAVSLPDNFATAVRACAIRFAAIACARALHEAIARNPLFVARFVNDAILAAGGIEGARVRLSPQDAAACADTLACEIIADTALQTGEVRIEKNGCSAGATLEERASLLVRAAADE